MADCSQGWKEPGGNEEESTVVLFMFLELLDLTREKVVGLKNQNVVYEL